MGHKFEPKVASLDTVPEPFRGFYTQGDEGFEMAPEVYNHLDTSQLASALEKERKASSAASKALKAYEPLGDPEGVQAKLKELQEALAAKGTETGQFEKFKTEVQTAHQKELEAERLKTVGMKGTLESYLVDAEANRALAELKGSPALLMPTIKASAKVVEDNGKHVVRILDAEGDPRYTSNGSFMTINDLVAEMKGHAEYGRAFEPSGTTGSGMRPGSTQTTVRQMAPGTMSAAQKIEQGLLKQQR